MKHWYVYHSQKTMGHSYESMAESAVYSTKQQPKLCIGDIIWVVEGNNNQPTGFSIADCFKHSRADYPSPYGAYSKYKLKVEGKSLLKNKNIGLEKHVPWFDQLHKGYITKQKFFVQIDNQKEVVKGLIDVSGVAI
ncbi:hypothetical protein ACFL3W_02135 [Pseudomonadota bacterium]